MEIVICEDDRAISRQLVEHLKEQGVFLITRQNPYEPKPTNFTPDREHGWYRQFEKNNKRKNFARK